MRASQLQYFCSVVEHSSFTAAARECHVAQPAISQQIKALEKELGFELLVRTSKGVQPTEAGTRYYQDASNILRLLDRARQRSLAAAEGIDGSICIGIASSSQAGMLSFIDAFHFRYPHIDIELRRARSAEIFSQLEHGDIDVLPVVETLLEGRSGIGTARRTSSQMVIALSPTHPLASKDVLGVDDLVQYPHIIAAGSNEATLLGTYPYLSDHPETKLLYAEDQGIGWLMMLLGSGVQAVPSEVADSSECVVRPVEGYSAQLGTCWAYFLANDNPALPLFLKFLENSDRNLLL